MISFFKGHYLLLLTLCFTILAYSNTFYADYQFDDLRVILEDGFIKDFSNFTNVETWKQVNLRPLALFSFALNYKIHGINIFGYHLVNLTIHLVTTILVYIFTIELKGLLKLDWTKQIIIIPALIFALHPIQTQAVTYIVQRMTSLATMFYLISIISYLHFRMRCIKNSHDYSITIILLFTTIISFIASIVSKQIGVSLLLAYCILELFVLSTYDKRSKLIGGISLMAITISIGTLWFYNLLPHPEHSIGRYNYFISQLHALPVYIKILFTGMGQNIDHFIEVKKTITLQAYFGITIYLAAVTFLIFSRSKIVQFSIGFFIFSMLLESSILPINDILVEHRMYLPLIPISIIIAFFANKITASKSAQTLLLLATLIIFSVFSYSRNLDWKTKSSIWQDSSLKNDRNPRAFNNYGQSLMIEKKYDQAIPKFLYTLKLNNTYHSALINISICLTKQNNIDKALYYAKKAMFYYPKSSDAHFAIANCYFVNGDFEQSKSFLSSALTFNIRNYDARHKRMQLYSIEKDTAKYIKDSTILMQLNPDYFVIEEQKYNQ